MIELDVLLVLIIFYGIYRVAKHAWDNLDLGEKIEEIKTVEKQYDTVQKFSERAKGLDKKNETIKNFTKDK